MKGNMKVGNKNREAGRKRTVNNTPRKWRYDGEKLYMLFKEGSCFYVIADKAIVKEGPYNMVGISLKNGTRYILKNANKSETLAV